MVCAREKSREALYLMYLTYLPFMTADNKISFKEFYDEATGNESFFDMRPKEEILERAVKIQNRKGAN